MDKKKTTTVINNYFWGFMTHLDLTKLFQTSLTKHECGMSATI